MGEGRIIRKRALLALAAALTLAVSACSSDSSSAPTPAPTPAAPTPATPTPAEPEPDPVKMEMVVFGPPSLGAFLPAVIAEKRFDLDNGLDITFVQRPPDAYSTEYGSGQFKVGGSASLISEAVRRTRGVETEYLFNVFDFFGAVVTSDDRVQTLADLEGKNLAAASSTTNYAMFQWFALQQGVNLDRVTLENTATPGLVTQALTGRSAGVQLWEPAYTQLLGQAPNLRTLDIGLERWQERFGFTEIPYLGVAALREWIDENEELIPRLQKTYADAAAWVLANPEEAAEIIAGAQEGADPAPLVDLIKNNDRLGLNVYSATDKITEIRAVFEVGVEIGYFDAIPDDGVIYGAAR